MRRRRSYTSENDESHFWPSFADLMSGFALILVLLMLFSWVHAMVKVHTIDESLDAAKQSATIRRRIMSALPATPAEGAQTAGEAQAPAALPYEISPSGTIIIRERVLFDTDKAEIKPEGEAFLAYWGQAFLQLLDNDELRQYIDVILVEGHTDNTGSREWNWLLSSQRAIAVISYLHQAVPRLASEYAGYLAAVGYSKYRPAAPGPTIAAANQTPDQRQMNRRIEFRIVLSDQKVLRRVIDSLTR